jgi:hypothetical protein
MQASQTPTLVPLPFATNGTKNTIPEASQISITPGAASLNDGFPPLTFTPIAAGGVPPAGADFNGILNLITQSIRWKHAGGQFGYNSTFANDANVGGYPRGALLLRSDQSGLWLNQTDNNATNPDTGGAGWVAAFMSGTVGQTRNLLMSVTAVSASATLTADEIVVGAALGGQKYVLGAFSKTINLATTGAGGMDTGAAPASGYVALYAIYNPTTGASALLATNATSTTAPSVYGGANMPSGYTASALVSVWSTNSSSQFKIGTQRDRSIVFPTANILTTSTTNASYTSLSLSAVAPLNAKSIVGEMSVSSNTSGSNNLNIIIAADANGSSRFPLVVGLTSASGYNQTVGISLMLATAQTLYYTTANGAGTPSFSISIGGYTI